MGEYIERSQARYIADYGIEIAIKEGERIARQCVGELFACTPKEDVVPVVRCKDCKYETSNQHVRELTGQYWCKYKLQPCNADDFCSYGERKEE